MMKTAIMTAAAGVTATPAAPVAAVSRKVLDKRALCQQLGISERTLWRLVGSGEIPKPFKLGVRCMWLAKRIDRHLERLQAAAG